MVEGNQPTGQPRFTTSLSEAMDDSEVLFIAVGSPPGEDGSAALGYVLTVVGEIGEHVECNAVIEE